MKNKIKSNVYFHKIADNSNSRSISSKLREKRFNKFLSLLGVDDNCKILDVGGAEFTWIGIGLEKNVTLLNINIITKKSRDFTFVKGDACNMEMFGDKEFNIVFSNSVIEHVGSFERQKLFAEEIRRVGLKYWVQSPSKNFPIEPHFLFPYFQYFPLKIQEYIGKKWPYSHLKRNNEDIIDELFRLRLLTPNEFNSLFPDASYIQEKYFGITKSLIAFKNSYGSST